MRIAAIALNLILSAFTALVLVTDGMPDEPHFIALSLVVLLVPAATAFAISRSEGLRSLRIANCILLALAAWAVATQYPQHPKEAGLLPYVVLSLVTPAVSVFALRRRKPAAAA